MPSFTSVASKLTPQAAPRAMLGQEIDLTERRNFLSASPFEISGFGTPARTAATTLTVASGVSLFASMLREASTVS